MSGSVVLDTNILVRAVLSGHLVEDAILKKAVSVGWGLIYGSKQMDELTEVLGYERIRRRYSIEKDEVIKLGKWLMTCKLVEPEKFSLCRDPDDNYVIGLAIKAAKKRKVYLVTGGEDILVLNGKIENVRLLTAGEFLAQE